MVYVFLSNGFEEMEALVPVDILRRAEIEVQTVGVGGECLVGAHGVKVLADTLEPKLDDMLEMIVLPGGIGYKKLQASTTVRKTIEFCAEKSIFVASICAAPSILGALGLLSGVRACCFPGYEGELKGALLSDEAVCSDKNFITARSAGHAVPFALRLVETLRGKAKASNVYNEIYQG